MPLCASVDLETVTIPRNEVDEFSVLQLFGLSYPEPAVQFSKPALGKDCALTEPAAATVESIRVKSHVIGIGRG